MSKAARQRDEQSDGRPRLLRGSMLAQVAAHAAAAHGITEITPGVLRAVVSKIAIVG